MVNHGRGLQLNAMLNTTEINTTGCSRWCLYVAFILILCAVLSLGFLATPVLAGPCTFSSTSIEYYVPANTSQDITGCGDIYLNWPLRIRAGAMLKGTLSDKLLVNTEADFIRMNSGAS